MAGGYGWNRTTDVGIFSSLTSRTVGGTAREAASAELEQLRREVSDLKEALEETLLEERVLKKSMHGVGDDRD